jgi:TRAP-type C4-dicarboxylate transport system permease small subunit
MSKAQRFWLGLLYGAMAILGAAYGVFEQQQAIDRLTHSMKEISLPFMKEILPFFFLLILALVVYGSFRAARSVLERLHGVSLAAHNTLHTNCGKAWKQIV